MADGIGGRPLLEARVRLRADGSTLGQEAVQETQKATQAAAAVAKTELSKGYREGATSGARAAADEVKKTGGVAGASFGDAFNAGAKEKTRGKGKGAIGPSEAEADQAGKSFGQRFGAKASAKIGEEFKSQAAGLGKGFIAAFAIDKFVGLANDSVKIASDLNEIGSALNVTFGAQGAAQIDKWSQSTAKGFGLATLEAENANQQFGIFAKSAGLTGQAAVDFSTRLTGLAGDLTSFYNPAGGTAQSIEAIGAALRGETEPIRQFGVLLDDATLRQEALKLGIVKTTKDALTPQQRVLASYSLILKQTKDAQGDFARTSDSLANSQRTLGNEFNDAKASIGAGLLPAYRGATSALRDLLAQYNKVSDEGAFGKAKRGGLFSPLLFGAEQIANAFGGDTIKKIQDGQAKAAELAASRAAAAADKVAAAKAREALAAAAFARSQEATSTAAEAATRAYGENTNKLQAMGLAGERVAAVAKDAGHEFDSANPKVQALGVAYERTAEKAAALAGGVGKATVSMGEQSGPAARAADGSAKLYRLYDGTAAKAAKFAEEQKVLADVLKTSPFLQSRDAVRQYEQSLIDATKAAKDNGKTLDVTTQKGIDNQAALDGLAQSALDYLDSINLQKGPGKEFQGALKQTRTDLINAGIRFGLTKKAAQQYADQVLAIPKKAVTQVNLAGVSAVNYSLDTILTRVNSLDGRRIQIYSSAANVREDRTPGKSVGGPVPGAPSEVDTRPYMLAAGEFVVRSRYASKPGNRAILDAMNAGRDVASLGVGGGVSGGGGSVDTAALAAAVAQGVRAAMASLPAGQVLLDGTVVGRLLRSGGGLAGIDAGGW